MGIFQSKKREGSSRKEYIKKAEEEIINHQRQLESLEYDKREKEFQYIKPLKNELDQLNIPKHIVIDPRFSPRKKRIRRPYREILNVKIPQGKI